MYSKSKIEISIGKPKVFAFRTQKCKLPSTWIFTENYSKFSHRKISPFAKNNRCKSEMPFYCHEIVVRTEKVCVSIRKGQNSLWRQDKSSYAQWKLIFFYFLRIISYICYVWRGFKSIKRCSFVRRTSLNGCIMRENVAWIILRKLYFYVRLEISDIYCGWLNLTIVIDKV